MNYYKLIILAIFLIFLTINYKLLLDIVKSILYSIIGRKYLPQKIIIFGKVIKNIKNNFLYKYFILLSWILLLLIILISFSSNLKLTSNIFECDYELLDGYEDASNCFETKNTYINEIIKPNINSPSLGYNYNEIILIGDYDNLQTKELIKQIINIYQINPHNIKYTYINAKNTNKSKIMTCTEFFYFDKYWQTHLIFANQKINYDENLENIFLRLDIDSKIMYDCMDSELIKNDFAYRNKILKESKIFAIPTIIINNQIFVGEVNVEKYIIK
jgi:hypothetical protein